MIPSSALRLMVIAGPPHVEPERWVDTCRAAEAGGATALQVRFKNLTAGEALRHTEEVLAVASVPVFVNDRADIAAGAGAAGVHVGQDDLSVTAIRAAFGQTLWVGLSVGTSEEVGIAQATDADYWSIGSVFATGTKSDAGTPIGIEGLRRLRAGAPQGTPVIAIGGINVDNVASVLAAGADGVAVSGAVTGASDVERAAAALRRCMEGLSA